MQKPFKSLPLARVSILLAACGVLSSCASVTEPSRQEIPLAIEQQWHANEAPAASVQSNWIKEFSDPALTGIIDESITNNFNIRAAQARVKAANAQATISGAARKPTASAGFDASRTNTSTSADTTSNQFKLSLNLGWEADLWGKLSHQSQAAVQNALAQESDLRNAKLSLAANIARNWFSTIEARQQVVLSERRVKNFQDTLDIINERYRQGIGDALDVRLARENLATAKVSLLSQRRKEDQLVRSLETLVGRHPSALLETSSELPLIESNVPAGIPSTLLNRRPDLVAAQHRLEASLQQNLQSSKNLLPDFRITASAGNATDELRKLLDWDNLFWSLAANITQPLFQGGKLEAQRTFSEANYEEALASYTQSVLTAFQEVETLLAATPLLQQQATAQAEANQESQDSAELAMERYQSGLTTITTLLDAQRRWFSAESALLNVSLTQIQNRIDLHLALGGDYKTPQPKKP